MTALDQIIQHLPDGAALARYDGTFVAANRWLLRLLSGDMNWLAERRMWDLMFDDSRAADQMIEFDDQLVHDGVVRNMLLSWRTATDQKVTVSLGAAPLTEELDGGRGLLLVVVHDATESQTLIESLRLSRRIIEEHTEHLERKIRERVEEIEQKNKLLEELSITDELTRLYNRRHFFRQAAEEFERSRRYGFPFAIVMLDLDHFKQINDRYHHQAGDKVLEEVARIVRRSVRKVDLAARYGGEEFVILLVGAEEATAFQFCERLREKVAAHRFEALPEGVGMRVSLGVAAYPVEGVDHVDQLIQRADAALYKAKETRDAAVAWSSLARRRG